MHLFVVLFSDQSVLKIIYARTMQLANILIVCSHCWLMSRNTKTCTLYAWNVEVTIHIKNVIEMFPFIKTNYYPASRLSNSAQLYSGAGIYFQQMSWINSALSTTPMNGKQIKMSAPGPCNPIQMRNARNLVTF